MRDVSAKRIKRILAFVQRDSDSLQALRRASLCLQLTGGVEGLMGSKVGQKISVDVPAGKMNFEILEVRFDD